MKRISLWLPMLLLVACGKAGQPPSVDAAAVPAGAPLAILNGQPITDEEIRKVVGGRLSQAEMGLYEAREDGIHQVIENRLLEAEAAKRGITREQLLEKEVNSRIKIGDSEIQKFYNEKKGQMGGKKLGEVKGQITAFLSREASQKLYDKMVGTLKKKADLAILIQPPKVEFNVGDAPSIGPRDAPVLLVEFTDYQCPFCSRARPTINQVLDTYKGKVRYALKDFPLSFHRESFKAHEAAHCAGEQGKYWDLNKKIWENQKSIKLEDLKKYAQEIRLNTQKFNQCLDEGKFSERVRTSLEEGQAVGVSGTPAFFINGRMISGARPFENFKEIIDAELARR